MVDSAVLTAPRPAPTRIQSQAEWQAALRATLLAAVAPAADRAASRHIVACSPTFEAWPWDDAELLAALVPWLKRPQRRLHLLCADPQAAWLQRYPRFARWRVDWMHAVELRAAAPDESQALPELLASAGGPWAQLLDRDTWRGLAGDSRREARLCLLRVDAPLQRSAPAAPARVLGL